LELHMHLPACRRFSLTALPPSPRRVFFAARFSRPKSALRLCLTQSPKKAPSFRALPLRKTTIVRTPSGCATPQGSFFSGCFVPKNSARSDPPVGLARSLLCVINHSCFFSPPTLHPANAETSPHGFLPLSMLADPIPWRRRPPKPRVVPDTPFELSPLGSNSAPPAATLSSGVPRSSPWVGPPVEIVSPKSRP